MIGKKDNVHERFNVIRDLGQGGFGQVVLAEDRATSQRVAIKTLIKVTPDGRERFEREALQLYRLLDNRHVVDLLEEHLDAEPPYIVLEYCEGGSFERFTTSPQPWHFVAKVMVHTLVALYAIHRANGFHRDIKPHNLLLAWDPDDGWIVKVADFGLARLAVTGASMTRGLAGTAGYIAPEVIMGEPFHPGADIFSLGIVAVELLTTRRDPDGLQQVDAPTGFLTLVRRMTSREMSQRPVVDEALGLLADLLRPLRLSASVSPGPSAPGSSPAKSEAPKGKGGLGAVALAVGVGAALAAIAALLAGDTKTWDANVRRYRGRNGRFKS